MNAAAEEELAHAGRRLILLRHAKAEQAAPPAYDDRLRVLATRGRTQSRLIGERWAAQGRRFDLALVSPALRTRQTWEILGARLHPMPPARLLPELYDATVGEALALLSEAPEDAARVLVVGHEPVMSGVAAYLAAQDSSQAALAAVRSGIATASACVLDVPVSWTKLRRASARLRAVEPAEG